MEEKNTIREELQALCPAVANLARINVYTVPEGYFQKLGERIVQYVKQNEEPSLQISSATPFNVPVGYFDGLAEKILNKAKQQTPGNEVRDELNSIAPFLNNISKVPVFSVPPNYFETLNIKVAEQKPARIFSFGNISKTVRYAVAAAIIGIVAIGSVLFINKEKSSSALSYKVEEIRKLSDKEIIEFLNAGSFAEVSPNSPMYLPQDQDYKQFMETLTEEEIQEFLKQNYVPSETQSKES
jgi:hypothetical protein